MVRPALSRTSAVEVEHDPPLTGTEYARTDGHQVPGPDERGVELEVAALAGGAWSFMMVLA